MRMLEEKPEKLVAVLLVEQREEVRMAKDRVADLVIRKGNLLKFHGYFISVCDCEVQKVKVPVYKWTQSRCRIRYNQMSILLSSYR